jgi:aryl-alcohol dehydrogenase-like predicted oxidoreductase
VERRSLGVSGPEVSVLGLGTAAMGGAASEWGVVDDRESIATIHLALDQGINLIETSPLFGAGHSETTVGIALRERRGEALIATAGGYEGPVEAGVPRRVSLAPAVLFRQCEESLRRLRLDQIDVYQCLAPDPEVPWSDTLGALKTLQQQGKIRTFGMCNPGVEYLAAMRTVGAPVAVQAPFSILDPRPAIHLARLALRMGVGFMAQRVLGCGLLTGKFDKSARIVGTRSHLPDFIGHRFQRNLDMVEALQRIAAEKSATVIQAALSWVLSKPGVTCVLVGARRPSQLAECVAAVFQPLDPHLLEDIDRLARESDNGH